MEDLQRPDDAPVKNGEKRPERDDMGRFAEGNAGGPGRPRGFSITERIRDALQEIPEGQKLSYLDAFIRQILKKAIIDGDGPTQKLLWNYIDGLPRRTVDLAVDGESLAELTTFFRLMARSVPNERQRMF